MLERVTLEARRVIAEPSVQLVRTALETALHARDRDLEDDHDPRYLHPGRTIRILIAETDCRGADALAAAAFVDTLDPHLVPDAPSRLRPVLDDVPVPAGGDDDDDLLERLVCAEREPALVALAEQLDQVRHIHMRPDLPWRALHDRARRSYVPAARRLAPLLARRFEHWADAFERRLLLRG